jgi:hypothetical protein
VGLNEEQSLRKKCGNKTQIARSHFEICCSHKNMKINSEEQHATFARQVQVEGGIFENLL